MKNQIIIYVLSILCAFSNLSAAITLTLDKTSVGIDETFTAIFSSNETIKGDPDFTPLQNDFKIISSAQNYASSYINGKSSIETQFRLILRPKHEGQLTIPSITFGNERSMPKTVDISPAGTSPLEEAIMLETEISPPGPVYPHTQLIYAVRLYRSVNLTQAGLSEIKISDPDAIIERIGKDAEYEYIHPNGMRYIVLERKYAVFPQHDGQLNFAPIAFEGEVIKGGNSFFNIQTQFKRVLSKAESVSVLPIPAPFQKSNWFAAQDLNLTEEWSADPSKITVGEPITWTLTLTAEGCLGSQIPELTIPLPPEVKYYLDKPEISNRSSAQGFTGLRKIKMALIATKPGEFTLPEMTIRWWDLKANQLRFTHLPSRIIRVDEGAIAMATPVPALSPSILAETENLDEKIVRQNMLPAWAWGLIGLNLIWIASCIKKIYQSLFKQLPNTEPQSFSRRQARSLLKQACHANDAKQAEIHLLAWATAILPQNKTNNLMAIKPYFSSPLKEAINDLNAALYSRNSSWEGQSLWKAVTGFKMEDKTIETKTHGDPYNSLRHLYSQPEK